MNGRKSSTVEFSVELLGKSSANTLAMAVEDIISISVTGREKR